MWALSAKTTKLQERQMNKKVVFDTSAFGKRVSAEIPEPTTLNQDNDVIIAMDEKQKMQKAGRYSKYKSKDVLPEMSQDAEEVNQKMDKALRPTPAPVYIINAKMVQKMIRLHPYIHSTRHLARVAELIPKLAFPTTGQQQYQSLLLSTKIPKGLTEKEIKRIATALRIKKWKMLIDSEAQIKITNTEKKAKAYIDEVARLEAEFDEE